MSTVPGGHTHFPSSRMVGEEQLMHELGEPQATHGNWQALQYPDGELAEVVLVVGAVSELFATMEAFV